MSKRAQGRVDPSVARPVRAPQPGRPPRRLRQLRPANDNSLPFTWRFAAWSAVAALIIVAGVVLLV